MKIVIVIDSWKDGNGCIITTKRMAREMVVRGHEVVVVTTGKHQDQGFTFHEIPGFYLPFVRKSMENMGFLFGKGKKKVLREAFRDADLIQIQFPFFLARNAVKMGKKMGIPVMAGCHIQPQNVVGAAGKENVFMENRVMDMFNLFLFKKVDNIQCPSDFAARMLKRSGNKATLHIISNGIPEPYKPIEMKRPDWFGDRFVIINVGRHAMEKRQSLLIEGVLRSKYRENIQLILAGKGEMNDVLKEKGANLPVKPLIEYISEEDKLTYLNTADIYGHSSIIELESLSCLEAIGCGLPCLIGDSPTSASSELFALDNRFIFKMDNADDLAARIDQLYEIRHELPSLRKDVLAMAEKYRFASCMDQMERMYHHVLRQNTSTSIRINTHSTNRSLQQVS